ncbi:MAG TPA: hypothetical protein VIH42_15255 [Thermoguttaceae bacterium]
MGANPKYKVIELMEGNIPRYTAMCRATESFAALAWKHRHVVDNALMQWLRSLDEPPRERVLLGGNVPLTRRTAVLLLRFRRDSIAKMCGSWPAPPDFALWPTICRGGYGRRRGVCRVKGDHVEKWESVEAAARALKTSRDDIDERVDEEHTDKDGSTWWTVDYKSP